MLFKGLHYARHCSKHSVPYIHHKNQLRKPLFIVHQQGNWGVGRLSSLPKVSWGESSRGRIWTCIVGASLVPQMVKNLPANAGDTGSVLGLVRSPWRREWQPTPVFLPEESHGQRSLVGYSPWGHKQLDMTEQLTLFTLLFWFQSSSSQHDYLPLATSPKH